jgi:lipopolysaccharide transport system ATP-binding protein
MNDIAIKVEGVSKKYRLGVVSSKTLKKDIVYFFKNLFNKSKIELTITENDRTISDNSDYVWSLKDVNFEIKKGEVVGIIGKNGAGKSTLLKILSQITAPTEGVVKINGKVASLLEVGTGFHPELTGRQNIFLNGSILGMNRSEIQNKFNEIVEFAGVQRYIDTPVKRYSSGMYVRLAFAIAAHLDTDILIIDEVLAVGDAEFQNKCIGKMNDISKKDGKTVLFVSHNINSISNLTTKCILMEYGKVKSVGKTSDVITQYYSTNKVEDLVYEADYNNEKLKVLKVEVFSSYESNIHAVEMPFKIRFTIRISEPIKKGNISFQIFNNIEVPIVHISLFDSDQPILREPGIHFYECIIPKLRLYMGDYKLSIFVGEDTCQNMLEIIHDICPFNVKMINKHRDYEWQSGSCAYMEEFSWTHSKSN